MAQFEYDVANGTGSEVRQGMNNVFDAVESHNSGASAPTPVAFKQWGDTGNDLLRIRDPNNSAWLTWGDVGSAAVYPVLFSEAASIGPDVSDDRVFSSSRVKEARNGWRSRIAAPATGANFANNSEFPITATTMNWGNPDAKETREIDPNVIQFDTVAGRFEIKKAGVYRFSYSVTCTADSINNTLTRARVLLRAYAGTTGIHTTDTAYTNTALTDRFHSAVSAQVVTVSENWEYEKTTTGTTEYVYCTLLISGTATSGGFQHTLNTAKASCELIERNEA